MRGRKFDLAATERYYSDVFSNKGIKGKKSRKSRITDFLKYMKAQSAAGRAPVKLKKGLAAFAAPFGAIPPPGSKVAMLPRKFSRGLDLRGRVPKYKTVSLETQIHFLKYLTPLFLQRLSQLSQESQDEHLYNRTAKFVSGLPEKPGTLYSVTLATGDYAKGSTFDKEKLTEFLVDLLSRFIKSKGVAQLADFAVAVNVITPRKSRKLKTKKRKAHK